MTADFSCYTKAAEFEGKLKTLKPGQRMRVAARDFLDMQVPANPLDKQTPKYLAEWFRVRMSFACDVREDIVTGNFDFVRH